VATFDKHYRVKELAELWSLSDKTIIRLFQDEPGVLKMGEPESRRKRSYFTLLIPENVAQRVHQRLRNK
jgi:hypothetical protein